MQLGLWDQNDRGGKKTPAGCWWGDSPERRAYKARLKKLSRAKIKARGGPGYAALLERERQARAKFRARNPERYRELRRIHESKAPALWRTHLVSQARMRGRRRGLESTITVKDIHWPSHCPVLGVKLFYPERRGEIRAGRPDLPSLDRWDNSRGYVPGNVFVISFRANTLKGSATAAELEALARYAKFGP